MRAHGNHAWHADCLDAALLRMSASARRVSEAMMPGDGTQQRQPRPVPAMYARCAEIIDGAVAVARLRAVEAVGAERAASILADVLRDLTRAAEREARR